MANTWPPHLLDSFPFGRKCLTISAFRCLARSVTFTQKFSNLLFALFSLPPISPIFFFCLFSTQPPASGTPSSISSILWMYAYFMPLRFFNFDNLYYANFRHPIRELFARKWKWEWKWKWRNGNRNDSKIFVNNFYGVMTQCHWGFRHNIILTFVGLLTKKKISQLCWHSHSVECIMQFINFVYHLKHNPGNQRLLQIFTVQIIESKSGRKIANPTWYLLCFRQDLISFVFLLSRLSNKSAKVLPSKEMLSKTRLSSCWNLLASQGPRFAPLFFFAFG